MNPKDLPLVSPRLKMAGWVHLPRFVSKIKLHHAGKLPDDYQKNFCKGFDGYWLEATGVDKDQFLAVVKSAGNDAAIEAWVQANVRRTPEQIEAYNQKVLTRGNNDDVAEIFQQRKKAAGLGDRADVQCFVDMIDADEGRL